MNISKTSLLMLIVLLTSPTEIFAEESSSNWFAGSGITFGSRDQDDGVSNSTVGIGLHGGYQFGNYLKLIVGANTFSGGDVSTMFAVIRPQWEFDNGFLVYVDLGVNGSSQGEGAGPKAGIGLGYNQGKHEITVGLDIAGVDTQDSVGGVALQYYYHF